MLRQGSAVDGDFVRLGLHAPWSHSGAVRKSEGRAGHRCRGRHDWSDSTRRSRMCRRLATLSHALVSDMTCSKTHTACAPRVGRCSTRRRGASSSSSACTTSRSPSMWWVLRARPAHKNGRRAPFSKARPVHHLSEALLAHNPRRQQPAPGCPSLAKHVDHARFQRSNR